MGGAAIGCRSDVNLFVDSSVSLVMVDADSDFDVMFRRNLPRAVALAERIVLEPALAEDLAAEAFARAYARWNRLRSADYVDGWVLRVVTNLAIDHLRRIRPAARSVEAPDAIDTMALRLALTEALTRLPRRQRQVIALRYFSDLSEADVARAMGVTVGAVKSHHRRALDTLRRHFGGHDREELFVARH